MTDWDSAVRRPPQHRVGKLAEESIINPQKCYKMAHRHTFVSVLILLISFVLLLTYLPNEHHCKLNLGSFWAKNTDSELTAYDETYPLTKPEILSDGAYKYKIAIITDLDQASKLHDQEHTWRSYLRYGYLTLQNSNKVAIDWDTKLISITSTLSQGGRGMELSDLKVFDGKLITVDDRTGVVYRIVKNKAIAYALLIDGNGSETKGFKGEWLTVKDQTLYVGGLGKEWTTTEGEFVNHNPMFIKTVSPSGQVRHLNWTDNYIKLRAAAGVHYPGYMIHESAQWSSIHRKWFFLPRRASNEMYTEKTDEKAATNLLIIADEFLSEIEVRKIGVLSETRGFSAFQFLPKSEDRLIVALKSEEDAGHINSYILVFDWTNGKIVVPETRLEGSFKFEGIEFV